MKRFLKTLLLFLFPLLAIWTLLAFSDPYSFFRAEADASARGNKKAVASAIDPRLWKLIEYDRDPGEILILGDSRANRLHVEYFQESMRGKVRNLAFGGGTLPEIIDTFREVRGKTNLQKVYIGINFDLYNGAIGRNLVPEAIRVKKSFLPYLTSRSFIHASVLYLPSLWIHRNFAAVKPKGTKDDFWKYQLESSAAIAFRIYSYPAKEHEAMKEIASYCWNHGVQLVFFIPPTHVDLQERISAFHLDEEREQFLEDLSALGDVYDFDYPNETTRNRDNFLDPFHGTDAVARMVVQELATGETRIARFTAGGHRGMEDR